jgi:hypothetical protein
MPPGLGYFQNFFKNFQPTLASWSALSLWYRMCADRLGIGVDGAERDLG